MQIFDIHFLSPLFLYGLFFLPVAVFFFVRQSKHTRLNKNFLKDSKQSFKEHTLGTSLKILSFCLVFILFILLLANPHTAHVDTSIKKNGIDIVLALDISKSMEAGDLVPSRLEKAKDTISEFIKAQKTNRVGLIVFAGKPLSSVPLTFDYNILSETISQLSTDTLNQNVSGLDGTAIGDALLMGRNLFQSKSEADKEKDPQREKVIILLTDGDANRGVDPVVASKLLADEGIKSYTIGIGSTKGGFIEVQNGPFKQKMQIPPLNTTSLKKIAEHTKGYFFRATDSDSLEKIFKKLEELEKNDIEVQVIKSFDEYYTPFIYLLLLFASLLTWTEIRRAKTV